MLHRRDESLSWAGTAAAFALGAAATWLVSLAIDRLRERPAQPGDDIVLERVRSCRDRIVAEPGRVDVSVENGIVRVSGQVQPRERDALLAELVTMPGVVRLRNALTTA